MAVPPFAGSMRLRDTATGVKVEFLTTGDYPGDGKPIRDNPQLPE